MPSESRAHSLRPFLAQGASPCEPASSPLPGAYDRAYDLWMVNVEGRARPIIASRNHLGDTATHTKVDAEHDDTDVSLATFGETGTSTATQAETDDTDITAAALEVATKTMAQVESEDHAFEIEAQGGEVQGFGGLALPIQ